MSGILIEPAYLACLLEARLEEVKVVRRRRTPPGLKRKRSRYYKRRKARIKRLAARRRRKPSSKRAAKRRARIRKRLGIKPGSRRRIQLASRDLHLNRIMEGNAVFDTKFELIRGFKAAAKLAETLEEKSIQQEHKEERKVYSSEFLDLPELPSLREDLEISDEDFKHILGIKNPKIEPTASGMAEDAKRMAECVRNGEIDLAEAHQILAMMTEELDKKAEDYLSGEQEEEVEEQYDDTDDVARMDEEKEEHEYTAHTPEEAQEKEEESEEQAKEHEKEVLKNIEAVTAVVGQIKEGVSHDQIRIYDNGGESFDRYTLVVDRGGHSDFYGLGADVGPSGFNQFLGTDQDGYREGSHLGKLIQLSDLSSKVKKAALARIDDDLAEMTMNGHGQGDEGFLVEVDPSLRPPKKWFEKMMKSVKGDDPQAIIGAIWRDLPVAKKKEIRAREGKHYGPAPKSEMTEDFKTAQTAFEKQGVDASEIKAYFEVFKKLKDQKIKDSDQKNIDKWAQGSWEEFKTFVDSIKQVKTKTQTKKLAKMEGAELITENEGWYVYKISTHEACMIYGSGSKWCITQQGGTYWKRYSRTSQFYFLISKDLPETDKWHKIAVQVERDGTVVYWDATDARHDSLPAELNVPEFKKEPKPRPEKTGKLSVEDIKDEYGDELNKIVDQEIQARVASAYDEDNYDAVESGQDLFLPYWVKERYERKIFSGREAKGRASSALKRLMELLPAVYEFVKEADNAYLSWSNSDGMMPWGDANYPDDAVILYILGHDGEEESELEVSDLMDMLGIDNEDEAAFEQFLEEEGDNYGIYGYEAGRRTVHFTGTHKVVAAVYMKAGRIAKFVEEILAEEGIEPEVAAEARDLVQEIEENAGSYN